MSYLCVGELDQARTRLEQMIAQYRAPNSRSHLIRFAFDQKTAALCALAYVLWLQGFPDQAARVAERAIEHADTLNHGASKWYVLVMCSCPIALLTGGIPALDQPVDAAFECAREHGMSKWKIHCQFWFGLSLLERGDESAYESRVAPALLQLGNVRHAAYLTGFSSALCEQLACCGKVAEALRLITAATERAQQVDDYASLPELLRVHGELLLFEAGGDAHGRAEEKFTAALNAAQSISARSWQLRSATSLARLWRLQGKANDAKNLLMPIYESFSEGFDTVDLVAARDLLASLYDGIHRQPTSVARASLPSALLIPVMPK
jgi:predicted ATPase